VNIALIKEIGLLLFWAEYLL